MFWRTRAAKRAADIQFTAPPGKATSTIGIGHRQSFAALVKIGLQLQPMNTFRAALVPGLIAGLVSVFGSWFWMGFVFHRFQKTTPETWRPEGTGSYIGASLLHVL